MQVSLAVIVFLLSILVPLVSADDAACTKYPVAVEEFVASVYTALVLSNDPNFVNNFKIEGGEAGMDFYKIVKEVYEELRVCNYEEIAFTAGLGVAKAGSLTIPLFWKSVAYAVGSSLYKHDILNCSNSLDLAFEYHGYVQLESKGLDKKKFETHVRNVSFGWRDILRAHNLDVGTLTTDAAAIFSQAFADDKEKKCKFDTDEDTPQKEDNGSQDADSNPQ